MCKDSRNRRSVGVIFVSSPSRRARPMVASSFSTISKPAARTSDIASVMREDFHEVTGAVFFIIAFVGIQSAWRAWQRGSGQWLVGVSAGYALLMIFFGVLSFRDSRRVR